VWLALGSNLGDRAGYLKAARVALEKAGIRIIATSSVADTQPVGFTEQPRFLNQVLRARTSLAPRPLLQTIKHIEQELGRRPGQRWGPREVDIDILLYGNSIIDEPSLQIPHPELPKRKFLLKLLAELNPRLRHPVEQRSMSALLEEAEQG
jgi:2-amino-4-hydroxy-6-hydroxymethyldihydropteridine diphosphokinase